MKIRKQNWPILFFLVVIIAISLFIWISIGRFNPVSVNNLRMVRVKTQDQPVST